LICPKIFCSDNFISPSSVDETTSRVFGYACPYSVYGQIQSAATGPRDVDIIVSIYALIMLIRSAPVNGVHNQSAGLQ
jgi:hypothetical protein